MKLNIANPTTGTMKIVECDDEKKLVNLYEKRISQEVDAGFLGDDFKGYVLRITGGNDKQGFPMSQGVMTNGRVRLLMAKGATYYRCRRPGERKRKSVRGCIVGQDLSTLNFVIVTKGEKDIEGLTNPESERAPRLGPKRINKLRALFNLSKEDDVRKYVVTREFTTKKGKKIQKRPKIQRLVTPRTLQHKHQLVTAKRTAYEKARTEKAEYERLRAQRNKERRDSALAAKQRRSSRKSSTKQTKA